MFKNSFLSALVIGNLGKDPCPVQTKTGTSMTTLSVAVTRCSKKEDDTFVNQTQWVGITLFGFEADRAMTLQKGDQVLVEGEPVVRTYQTREGGSNTMLEIRATRLVRLTRSAERKFRGQGDGSDAGSASSGRSWGIGSSGTFSSAGRVISAARSRVGQSSSNTLRQAFAAEQAAFEAMP